MLCPHHTARKIFLPQPGTELTPAAVAAWGPKHWVTRQAPDYAILKPACCGQTPNRRSRGLYFLLLERQRSRNCCYISNTCPPPVNKEDKPEAVHLQKTAEEPERTRRRWGGTQGRQDGRSQGKEVPRSWFCTTRRLQKWLQERRRLPTFTFPSRGYWRHSPALVFLFALGWGAAHLWTLICTYLSVAPTRPRRPPRVHPGRALVFGDHWNRQTGPRIRGLSPTSSPHLRTFTFPYLPSENFCETPFIRWYNYMAISKKEKEKSTHFTLDSFHSLIRKGDVCF